MPIDGNVIIGEVLKPGTVLEATDMYLSKETGTYQKCFMGAVGAPVPNDTDTIWVRLSTIAINRNSGTAADSVLALRKKAAA